MVNYSYLPDSDLIAGYTNNSGLFAERVYEPDRNLIASIRNRFGGSLVSQFDYANDAVGRRTRRIDRLSTTNVFGYNLRSELTEANMGTNVFAYAYDSIGNRRRAGANSLTNFYAANELNQYLAVTNAFDTSSLSYDSDGNLTNDGTFAYVWDAENRLVAVISNGATVVSNRYDYMFRRVARVTGTGTNCFVYDGWNMIRETQVSGLGTNFYVWGLDLSGTLQGAGGIGGLLCVLEGGDGSPSRPFFPTYDGNGNIADYVGTNGAVVAHYEYDPYGNALVASGSAVSDNPYRFSTKYLDSEVGLCYYGFRFYSPTLGRWVSRDPIEDKGFHVRTRGWKYREDETHEDEEMQFDNIRRSGETLRLRFGNAPQICSEADIKASV